MKKRSEVARDFTGGFIGGTVGLLLFKWLFPTIPWLGVIGGLMGGLVGVFLGWNAEEIFEGFTRAWQQAQSSCNRIFGRKSTVPKIGIVGKILIRLRRIKHEYKNSVDKMARIYRGIYGRVISCPASAKARLCIIFSCLSHPANKAMLVSIVASIFVWILHVFVFIILYSLSGASSDLGGLTFLMSLIFFCIACFHFFLRMQGAGLPTVNRVNFIWEKEGQYKKSVKKFYSIERCDESLRAYYERWEAYGSRWFFTREVASLLFIEFGTIFLFAFSAVYWVTFGGMLISFVVLPISMFVFFMCQMYKLVIRPRWWLCAHVTTLVLGLSFVFFHDYVNTWSIASAVAIGVGFTSGVLTLLVRRVVVWWSNSETGNHYLVNVCYDDNELLPFYLIDKKGRILGRFFERITSSIMVVR